jgi:probable HAF family extracellular repeat protein
LCPSGYSVTHLPLLSGGTWGYAYGLNNATAVQVVGESALTGVDGGHAVLWQQNGGGTFAAQDLGTLGLGTASWALAVNDAGQVAGYSGHAFLWTPGGTDGVPSNPQMKDLGTFGGPESKALAISPSGSVVGYSNTSDPSVSHAFVWEHNVMYDLNALVPSNPGWVLEDAHSINATQIVGTGTYYGQGRAYLITDLDGDGFFSTGSLQITDLGAGYAVALSPSGLVAGFSFTPHATLWQKDAAGTYMAQDLGTLGGAYSRAVGVNDAGQAVGNANTRYGANDPFLWQSGHMIDLYSS